MRWNSTEGSCVKLLTVGGANYSELINASRTCGPAGEWKRRIAENLSSVFFQGGLDWVKNDNETIEIQTEDGTYEAVVSEEKYSHMADCWKRACGCEQAANPVGRAILFTLLAIMVGGLGIDSLKLLWEKWRGQKPPKHVQCKKGHRVEEVKFAYRYFCDMCGKPGTCYQCSVSCNYDLCKNCYKGAKKKIKDQMKEWLERHPEDQEEEKKKKKKDKGDDNDDDRPESDPKEEAEGKLDAKVDSETETKAESEGTDADTKKDDADEAEGKEDDAAGEGESREKEDEE